MDLPSIDLVIRFKNEEFWLKKLKKKFKRLKGANINLYGVDNNSVDHSKAVFEGFENVNLKSINYQNLDYYTPGRSLNLGAIQGNSELILFLSAHCIPKDDDYLTQLQLGLVQEDDNCAGIYGRQLPLPCSGAQNTVDLTLTYPKEDRILRRTPLFNNANSMVRREVFELNYFNEVVTNLEDLIWAKKLQNQGYYFKYTSNAEVYHFHGIHQHKLNTSSKRISNSLKVLLRTGWLTIDSPDICDYRDLTCLIESRNLKKRYLAKISNNDIFQFIAVNNNEKEKYINSTDYYLFSSADLNEEQFTLALKEVAEQTSQMSLIGKEKKEHNLQDVLSLKEIGKMIESDTKSLLFVSSNILNLLENFNE